MAVPIPTQGNRGVMAVFAGLLLGMLVASLNMTLVAPAMPTIVAQLGGIEHYSWIAISALLASTVAVPIVGKLSDLYGRKPFFMGGIVVFTVGSALAGLAPTFWFLVFARAVQGIGMGTIQPLSQAIIGDIVSPRERGKYQGMIGAVFGLASIIGPAAGGFITDNFTWRWLFFVNIPVSVVALAVIAAFMHVPQDKRPHAIDSWGIVTLSLGLTAGLLATAWGGSQYPWNSLQILGLYGFAVVMLTAFVWIETWFPEPVLPLHLWRNSIFTSSNIAGMAVAMGMFGAIYFIPVFVQGVLGNNATNSGAILVPMLLAMVVTSVLNGQLITWTGRYKPQVLVGLAAMGLGFYLLTQMDAHTDNGTVIRNMILIGLGLGVAMQTFVLIVQNAVSRADMGVATAATQLFRSVGASVGIAVMGTILTQSLVKDIPKYVPAEALAAMRASGQRPAANAGSVLDPSVMQHLPLAVLTGIRAGLSDALHQVFLAGLLFAGLAILAALFIKEIPLRRTAHVDARGRETERLAEAN